MKNMLRSHLTNGVEEWMELWSKDIYRKFAIWCNNFYLFQKDGMGWYQWKVFWWYPLCKCGWIKVKYDEKVNMYWQISHSCPRGQKQGGNREIQKESSRNTEKLRRIQKRLRMEKQRIQKTNTEKPGVQIKRQLHSFRHKQSGSSRELPSITWKNKSSGCQVCRYITNQRKMKSLQQ